MEFLSDAAKATAYCCVQLYMKHLRILLCHV